MDVQPLQHSRLVPPSNVLLTAKAAQPSGMPISVRQFWSVTDITRSAVRST